MPAVSKKQRRLMAMVEHTPESKLPRHLLKIKRSMTRQQLHEFAATPEKGLPLRKRR